MSKSWERITLGFNIPLEATLRGVQLSVQQVSKQVCECTSLCTFIITCIWLGIQPSIPVLSAIRLLMLTKSGRVHSFGHTQLISFLYLWHSHVIDFTRFSTFPFNFICAWREPQNKASKLNNSGSNLVSPFIPNRRQSTVDLEIFVLQNFPVLNFRVKIFSWSRIPTKIF